METPGDDESRRSFFLELEKAASGRSVSDDAPTVADLKTLFEELRESPPPPSGAAQDHHGSGRALGTSATPDISRPRRGRSA